MAAFEESLAFLQREWRQFALIGQPAIESPMIVDEVIANLSSDENAKSDILDKMIDYLIENKEKIERETGKKLDLSGIDKFRNSEEYKTLNEAINETISETSSGFSANDKKIIRTYSFTVSNNFRLILIGCFIATLCLIALLQWSFYKWIGTLGSSCLVSGVTLVVLHFVSKLLITSLLSSMSTNVTVDVSSLLYFGISCIVLAIVLYIVKKILSKIFGNRSDKLDTSEASA